MRKLNPTTRAWLKFVHVFFIAVWLGSCCCLLLLQLISHPIGGDEAYATNSILKSIDDTMVAPSAILSLLTGLLISWLTPWGFFKWRWVTLKWILTVGVILTGSLLVGPRLNGMTEISASERGAALQNATYLNYKEMLPIFSLPVVAGLVVMLILSVLKPWGRSKSVTKS